MISYFASCSTTALIIWTLVVTLAAVIIPRFLKSSVTETGEKKEYMDLVSVGQVLFDDNKKDAGTCVHCCVVFEEKIDFSKFVDQFLKLHVFKTRFAMRLIYKDGERPYWIQAGEKWHPGDNIEFVDTPMDHAEVSELLGQMCSTPLDTDFPLWRMAFVDNYTNPKTNKATSAMIWKYHHSVADGFTAMRHVMAHCTPANEAMKIDDAFPARRVPAKGDKSTRPSVSTLLVKSAAATAKLVGLPKDPVNPIKPNYRLIDRAQRICSFGGLPEKFSVRALKALAHAASEPGHKLSVNDILIAGLSRALGKYCQENKDKPGVKVPADLLSAVWVSLSTGSPFKFNANEPLWGNSKLGVVYLSLPVAIQSVTEQINAVYTRLRDLVGSPEPLLANRLQALVASLPYSIAHFVWPLVTDKISISVSNVPGPQAALRWPVDNTMSIPEQHDKSGIIEDLMFFVPPVNDIGIMATMMSYNDKVTLGISTAAKWIDQAHADHLVHHLFPKAMGEIADDLLVKKHEDIIAG